MSDVKATIRDCLGAVEQIRSAALRNHDAGVGDICAALCRGMGLESGLTATLAYAARLHDIGKIVVPEAIINKPGPLDAGEIAVMRQHPMLGFQILSTSGDSTVKAAANAARYHHECWDGSGYPEGLAGEAIPREARIVAICDVYHALRETRSYRAGLPHDQVMGMILSGDPKGRLHSGKFDPAVAAGFRASADAIREAFDALG